MLVRRPLPFAIALALLACTPTPEQKGEGEAASKTAAESEPSEAKPTPPEPEAPDYSSFGEMPEPGPWSVEEYARASKILVQAAKQDFKLLPRDGSPLFAALTDVDHLAELVPGILPNQLAGLSISLAGIHSAYANQIARDPELEREWLMLGAAVVFVTSKLPGTVVKTEAEAVALRDEPSRLKGLLRYRHGVSEKLEKMVAFEPKSTLSYAFACAQVARVIDDAATLLLPEERAAARTRLEACASAGADPKVVEQLERALAEDAPTAAFVTALLPEHREFAAAH